jgi:dihydrofolate reductase
MKLTTITNVSVDGVMQGLGGPDEDRRGGFERGGWAMPLFDNEAATIVNEIYGRADAFLFGRRTYEIFAPYWGVVADPSVNPIAKALNTMPKYVVSVPRHRPGHSARTGRIAGHPQRGDPPGLPTQRAPAVRPQYGTSTADMKHVR